MNNELIEKVNKIPYLSETYCMVQKSSKTLLASHKY